MPQLNTLVLTDSANTEHSFAPRGVDANGVATLVKSTGVPIGDEKLTISRSRTAQGREKVVMKLTLPVQQNATVDGISRPTVVRSAYAEVTFSFDGTSNTAERAVARSLVADLLADATSVDVIDDLESLF